MSLRYKALAVVLVLVTAVTGGLVAYVSWLYDGVEREDIKKELAVDAERFRDRVDTLKSELNGSLQASMVSEQLELFYKGFPDGLAGNFDTKIEEWRKQTGADAGFAAMESFLAKEEKKARSLHDAATYSVIGWTPDALSSEDRDRFLKAEAFHAVLGLAFDGMRSVVEVIPVGERIYVAVACPFFNSNQTFIKFRRYQDLRDRRRSPPEDVELKKLRDDLAPDGAAIVLKELSSAWLKGESIAADNPIHQVLFSGNRVSATSFKDASFAPPILTAAGGARSTSFEVRLPDGTWIGEANSFAGAHPGLSGTGFIAIKNLDKELVPLQLLIRNVSFGGVVFALLGAIAAFGLASIVIRKLGLLKVATDRVRDGDFTASVDIRGSDEIAQLGGAFNNMIKGLQALGLYTDTKLARSVLDNPELIAGKSARYEGTVLFTDIKNFTGITETMDAETLTTQLNEYFSAIGDHVKREEGYVDKFIGDAVMAFWGPPFIVERDFAVRACRAALKCIRATADLRRFWEQQGRPLFFQRIGIATGEVVVGNIGSQTKKNFTVIGDSVNLASRLEGASKIYGTEVLADERTIEVAGSAVLSREIDEILVRGKQKPVRIFEVLGLATETSTKAMRLIRAYGKALGQYRKKQFGDAIATLAELSKTDPDDGPSKWLWNKCQDALAGTGDAKPTPITRGYGQPVE